MISGCFRDTYVAGLRWDGGSRIAGCEAEPRTCGGPAGFLRRNEIPTSWDALFEARYATGSDRIPFALAGMNAHINGDLAFALLQTDAEFELKSSTNSPEHDDFEHARGSLI
jgi:Family of unknown function (DUF5995)